jgi:hypothetical protein
MIRYEQRRNTTIQPTAYDAQVSQDPYPYASVTALPRGLSGNHLPHRARVHRVKPAQPLAHTLFENLHQSDETQKVKKGSQPCTILLPPIILRPHQLLKPFLRRPHIRRQIMLPNPTKSTIQVLH